MGITKGLAFLHSKKIAHLVNPKVNTGCRGLTYVMTRPCFDNQSLILSPESCIRLMG